MYLSFFKNDAILSSSNNELIITMIIASQVYQNLLFSIAQKSCCSIRNTKVFEIIMYGLANQSYGVIELSCKSMSTR